ncbi:MAG: transposase [Candidatus Fimenecus sp.]
MFFDNEDYLSFLSVLKNTCKSYNASLCAYCLMRNHVHLLMQFSERNAAHFLNRSVHLLFFVITQNMIESAGYSTVGITAKRLMTTNIY